MKTTLLFSLFFASVAGAAIPPSIQFTNTLPAIVAINTNRGSIYVQPLATIDLSSTFQNYDLTLLSSQVTALLATGVLTSPSADPVGDMYRATVVTQGSIACPAGQSPTSANPDGGGGLTCLNPAAPTAITVGGILMAAVPDGGGVIFLFPDAGLAKLTHG